MIAVITGGRDLYPNFAYIDESLSVLKVDGRFPPDLVIRLGACPTGVDLMVELFCIARGIKYQRYPAKWDLYGKSAGPIRNRDMIIGADICCSFPGGKGTADCRRAAKDAGVRVSIAQSEGILHANKIALYRRTVDAEQG